MLGTVHSHEYGSCDRNGTICAMETLSLIMNKKLIHLLLYTRFKTISPYLLISVIRCTLPSNIFCLYKRTDSVSQNVNYGLSSRQWVRTQFGHQ